MESSARNAESCNWLFPRKRAKRIDKLAALDWPPHILQRVDAAEASMLAGIELAHGGLWFPAGGWVVPPRMCAALAANPAIVQLTGYRVGIPDSRECWLACGGEKPA